MNPFDFEASFPPSLASQPILTMLTVMSFWAVTMICLRWIWDTIESAIDMPAPRHSYVRQARSVRLWLVAALFLMTAPRLAQLMLWQLMTAGQRDTLSGIAWAALIPASGMIVYAWWRSTSVSKTEIAYTQNSGFYAAAEVTPSEKKRGVTILVLIFVVAFATTFVRPANHASAPATSAFQRR